MEKQTRSPRYPNPDRSRRQAKADPIQNPSGYLEHRRGGAVARQVVETAKATVASLDPLHDSSQSSLTNKERRQRLTLAKQFLPHVSNLPPLPKFLEMLIQLWGKKPKSGRRLQRRALFARTMLSWAAGELGARGMDQLTATELMAAAVAGGLQEIGNGEKRKMLDSWRKLARSQAPADPKALADSVRELIRLKEETARREAELKASEERTKHLYRTLSEYLDGVTAGAGR